MWIQHDLARKDKIFSRFKVPAEKDARVSLWRLAPKWPKNWHSGSGFK
jgi:hypothetical protein